MIGQENEKSLIAHYNSTYEKYGFNSHGADWGDKNKHDCRLNQMIIALGAEALLNKTILDVGCGYGHLIELLVKNNLKDKVQYIGIDPCSEAIDYANSLNHKNTKFECARLEDYSSKSRIDTAICCGIFTKKLDLSEEVMTDSIIQFFNLIKRQNIKHVCFNTMSFLCDKRDESLFYPKLSSISDLIRANFGYSVKNLTISNQHLQYELIWRFSL